MTRADKIAKAEALRDRGSTYREIAAELGVGLSSIYRWLNPDFTERQREKARDWKAAHPEHMRAYARAYHIAHRVPCPECGHLLSRHANYRSNGGVNCPGCVAKRRNQIVRWWAEGLLMREIAERLGWTKNHMGVEFARMRRAGYDLAHRRDPEWVENIRDGLRRIGRKVPA